MDPNENLKRQLEAAREILAQMDGLDSDQWSDEQDRSEYFEAVADIGVVLAEHVLALDEWLSKGGFKPARWS